MKTNKPALLDVNVLIALTDKDHIFHAPALAWFKANHRNGWATCPITENGCIRVMGHPGYPCPGLNVATVRTLLSQLVRVAGYLFWPDSVSLLDEGKFDFAGAGPKQLTDVYLLGLVVKFDGKLVTFDRGIRWQSVIGCKPENLEVI